MSDEIADRMLSIAFAVLFIALGFNLGILIYLLTQLPFAPGVHVHV